MKVLVLGWKRMRGVGKKTGNAYDFAQLIIASEIRLASGEKLTVTGGGYEPGTIDLRLGCEGQFSGIQFPKVLDLITDNKIGNMGRLEAEVTGIVPQAPPKAA